MRAKSANRVRIDDVRTVGGKDIVLKRLVNHYKAISNAKPEIKIDPPKLFTKNKTNFENNIYNKDEYYNIRQTYKGVANVKATIDDKVPFTFKMGKSQKNGTAKEQFQDFEHVRRLISMQKRIISIGKPHERKKNINDPIANPIYFFKKAGDTNAIKLVSLETFSKKLKTLNREDKNKNLLNEMINSLSDINKTEENKEDIQMNKAKRPSSSVKVEIDNRKNNNTHIHIDPEEFLKKHLNERKKLKKEEEKELLLFTRNSTSSLNKSRKMLKIPTNSNCKNINTNFDNILLLNFNKTEQKVTFPIYETNQNSIEQEPKENFKSKIINYIITKRIFRDYDMDILLKQLLYKNKAFLSEQEIIEIFNHIKSELEK